MCIKGCKMICLLIPLGISLAMILISYQLANRASALNEQQNPNGTLPVKPYDQCDTTTFDYALADLGLGES